MTSAEDARAFVKDLRRRKKFAKATHNTWAVWLPDGPLKNDDGESGAGMGERRLENGPVDRFSRERTESRSILRMLEREGLEGHIIVVTRWFGGVKLGGDRFRRVQDAVRVYLEGVSVG